MHVVLLGHFFVGSLGVGCWWNGVGGLDVGAINRVDVIVDRMMLMQSLDAQGLSPSSWFILRVRKRNA